MSPVNPTLGIVLMLGSTVSIPICDAIAKYLSDDYSLLQIVWARYFFHCLVLLPFAIGHHGRGLLAWRYPGLQLARGLCLVGSTGLFFAAIAVLPLADSLALLFVFPLVVTVLSPWWLKESVSTDRWLATVVGFIGICIILQPGVGLWHRHGFLALAAGVVLGGYFLLTRQLSYRAPVLVTSTYTTLVGVLATSLLVGAAWTMPSALDWFLMLSMGATAALTHILIALAFERAPAALLAPFGYAEMITATALGYVVFGDFPRPLTWLGILVVIASGIYLGINHRQRRTTGSTGSTGSTG